jgi:hypothetical protein
VEGPDSVADEILRFTDTGTSANGR